MMKHYITTAGARWAGWQLGGALLLAWMGAVPPARAQASFAAMQSYSSGGTSPYGLAVADLNGDGRPDLVTGNSTSSTIGVLLATATGTSAFAPAATYAAGAGAMGPLLLTVGDVNADGRPDVVASTYLAQRVVVLLNSASSPGTLLPAVAYSPSGLGLTGRPVALGDVNADGRPDLLIGGFDNGSVGVLLNQAAAPGTFGPVTTYATGGTGVSAVALADLNADGRPDLVVVDHIVNMVRVLLGLATPVGTFGTAVSYAVSGNTPYSLVVADVNGDNRPDVLTAGLGTPSGMLNVLLNSATTPGTLLAAATYYTGGGTPIELSVGDLNNDGRPDVAGSNLNSDAVVVLLGSATAPGTFGIATTYAVGTGPRSIVIADVNRDNKRDLVVANLGSNTVGVLLNQMPLATAPLLAAAADVALYPNPAHGSCQVQLPAVAGAAAVQAELLDALGRVVQRQRAPLSAPGSAFTLPTTALPAGVYLLRLTALNARAEVLGTLPVQRLAVE